MLSILGLGIFVNYHMIFKNNFSAGLFAPQDIWIFKEWLVLPYTKIHCIAVGLFMGYLWTGLNRKKAAIMEKEVIP